MSQFSPAPPGSDHYVGGVFTTAGSKFSPVIAEFLDRETAKLDALTAEAQTAITLLQERRTALISAAVTGKLDVRGFQPDSSL